MKSSSMCFVTVDVPTLILPMLCVPRLPAGDIIGPRAWRKLRDPLAALEGSNAGKFQRESVLLLRKHGLRANFNFERTHTSMKSVS